ncbi:lysozyme inhibitor LprI family protein [Roseibaca sp. Y0-43]|uniref:lysozyme inhibitor LprI family protein n=1 Tax=Roseibaca sp. Y0-43 TaxID=2816854 RepID=UPI001D0C435C|nr:lysozyme inhibitor LprI family protein [Roseibaca sp. Y0-43]MCC1482118.1 DUF1311 domain-containing protein [Roseibaca sp. Y0-43]
MLRFLLPLSLFVTPVLAQDMSFQIGPTEDCLAQSGHGADKHVCIGRAAAACMEQASGASDDEMSFCLLQEFGWWDQQINDVTMDLRRAMGQPNDELPADLANQASTARDLYELWVFYRKARCDHEASFGQVGAGAGPDYLQCLLQETAEQALYLGALYSGEG